MQVIISGNRQAPETAALLDAAYSAFAPDKVVIPVDTSNPDEVAFYKRHNPHALDMVQQSTQEVSV